MIGTLSLEEWRKLTGAKLHHFAGGMVKVFEDDIPNAGYKYDLFHLYDYVVTSSVSGPAFNLLPRDWAER